MLLLLLLLLLSWLRTALDRELRTLLQRLSLLLGRDGFLHELVTLLNDWSDASGWLGDRLDRDGGARNHGLDGTTVILVEELLLVLSSRMDYLNLGSHWRGVIFVHRNDLAALRPHAESTGAAVIADGVLGDAVIRHVIDHDSAVVDVRDVGVVAVDIRYSTVVLEVVALPVAAIKAGADVAVTVIDTAVVADVRAPVADVESKATEGEAPVGRCPESAVVRRGAPDAGNPVVATVVLVIAPVAGGPEVIWLGWWGLLV